MKRQPNIYFRAAWAHFKRGLVVLLGMALCGCAGNYYTVTADHGSTVNCTGSVDKPTTVTPSVKADGNTLPVMP